MEYWITKNCKENYCFEISENHVDVVEILQKVSSGDDVTNFYLNEKFIKLGYKILKNSDFIFIGNKPDGSNILHIITCYKEKKLNLKSFKSTKAIRKEIYNKLFNILKSDEKLTII